MVPEASRENGMFDGWEKLSWEERRERRIERWMRPAQVEFADESVRASYEERVQIIIDALKLRKPTRVPLLPQMGYYTTRYSGLTAKESMYDYEKLAKAWWKFHEDFRPDAQADAGIPGRPFDLLGGRFLLWPGHGVGDDTTWQYVEAEYMKAEDYDALIADPSGYFMRVLLPRFAEGFEPLAALDPFSDILEVATLPFNLAAFADPAVLEGCGRRGDRRIHRGDWHDEWRGPGSPRPAHVACRPGQSALRHPGRHLARHAGHRDGPLSET
jgi:hypothetical protein